jgi:glycosyltransferase involved in cell wall biosynthesis
VRVLHVNAGNLYGGVETLLVTLAREARHAPGMSPSFGVCYEGRYSRELESIGQHVHDLGPVRFRRPDTVLHARRILATLLDDAAFDVVVCHQPWSLVAFGSVIRAASVPVVLWIHMAGDGHHWVDRLAARHRPDLVICNSDFSRASLGRWSARAPLERIYYPVSVPIDPGPQSRRDLRQSFGAIDGDVVVVQVSRLESWKGQHVLLSALVQLREVPQWSCWIVGGAQQPKEAAYLKELRAIAELGGIAPRVRFLGERNDVPAVLRAADVFCQANAAPEPFGLALVEALHAGLPVVTSQGGGAIEIVDDSCGALTPVGDTRAVAETLRTLVTNGETRARLAEGARRRTHQLCDPARQMRQIEAALARVARPSLAATGS